jgi:hypothetical protein
VHILEQPYGQSWIVTWPCAIEMIDNGGSACQFPVGNAGSGRPYEAVTEHQYNTALDLSGFCRSYANLRPSIIWLF